jgi:signal transduction histidine kinase
MSDVGFAIRCPYCREWNIWRDIRLDDVVLNSAREFREIVSGLETARQMGHANVYSHPKLFRCKSASWVCPTSFEAVVCNSEARALECIAAVQTWSSKRDFRLPKADRINRWEGDYYGILFCTQPVRRDPNIELERLIDRELLRRLMAGLAYEVEGPVTIFSANLFRPHDRAAKLYWMPIEGYSHDQRLAPPRFNTFCRACREVVVRQFVHEFEDAHYTVDTCPVGFGRDGKCAGKEAACMEEAKDWNHCPAFIEKRSEECPCYRSDLVAIQRVKENWADKADAREIIHECDAGFKELAFPIVVHGYLVGVAMTGQVFLDTGTISEKISDFIAKNTLLKGYKARLLNASHGFVREEGRLRKGGEARFFLSEDEVKDRVRLLRPKVDTLSDMANSRYYDFRWRQESAFREEVLGHIRNHKMKAHLFEEDVPLVLERMRQFWAFEAAYLSQYSCQNGAISVIALSTRQGPPSSFGVPGLVVGHTEIECEQMHPCPCLYRRGQDLPRHNPLLQKLLSLFERASRDPALMVPEGKTVYAVLVPSFEEVYAFVFIQRDRDSVCSLPHPDPDGVSHFCQDAAFGTCTEVIYELGEIRNSTRQLLVAREDLNRLVSQLQHALLSLNHQLQRPLFMIRGVLSNVRDMYMTRAKPEHREHIELGMDIAQQSALLCRGLSSILAIEQGGELQGKVRDIIVRTEIEKLAEAMRRAQDGTDKTFEYFSESPTIRMNELSFLFVFYALIDNALKYAEPKSRIEFRFSEEKPSSRHVFRVRSKGLRIDEKYKERVFEKFWRHEEAKQYDALGLGIGCWAAREHMKRCGGDLYLEVSGDFSTFVVVPPSEMEQ